MQNKFQNLKQKAKHGILTEQEKQYIEQRNAERLKRKRDKKEQQESSQKRQKLEGNTTASSSSSSTSTALTPILPPTSSTTNTNANNYKQKRRERKIRKKQAKEQQRIAQENYSDDDSFLPAYKTNEYLRYKPHLQKCISFVSNTDQMSWKSTKVHKLCKLEKSNQTYFYTKLFHLNSLLFGIPLKQIFCGNFFNIYLLENGKSIVEYTSLTGFEIIGSESPPSLSNLFSFITGKAVPLDDQIEEDNLDQGARWLEIVDYMQENQLTSEEEIIEFEEEQSRIPRHLKTIPSAGLLIDQFFAYSDEVVTKIMCRRKIDSKLMVLGNNLCREMGYFGSDFLKIPRMLPLDKPVVMASCHRFYHVYICEEKSVQSVYMAGQDYSTISNPFKQLTFPQQQNKEAKISKVSTAYNFTAFLFTDGTVFVTGNAINLTKVLCTTMSTITTAVLVDKCKFEGVERFVEVTCVNDGCYLIDQRNRVWFCRGQQAILERIDIQAQLIQQIINSFETTLFISKENEIFWKGNLPNANPKERQRRNDSFSGTFIKSKSEIQKLNLKHFDWKKHFVYKITDVSIGIHGFVVLFSKKLSVSLQNLQLQRNYLDVEIVCQE